MISTLQEAEKHANHTSIMKHKYVIVLPDGSIYNTNDDEVAVKAVKDNEIVFMVKGEIQKDEPTKEVKTKKFKETKE